MDLLPDHDGQGPKLSESTLSGIHDARSFEPMTDNCKLLMLSMLVVFISISKCLLNPAQ